MRLKMVAFAVGVIAVLGGGYAAYDYYAGNHVTVEGVIPASGNNSVQAAAGVIEAAKLSGQWSIKQPDSKVYISVTTSKETVNIEAGSVTGVWTLDSADAGKMKAEAAVSLGSLQSGNGQRDNHIKGANYLDAAAHPEAKFALKGFENFPKEWKEGEKVSFNMNGTLTVKGISKDVTFKNDAVYSQGTIRMEGSTVVTFADFGMKNPHAVVLDTENNVTVQTRLVLEKV
ncbi:YceI family protein [Paenibacillus hamazuiensis]|uniref:YceI family protein n=1 Tax=Paenibacillus hamazuiensis TaxID=2936508 RepID=UPI00200D5346|nr:YceI family protein [Paenibacillus hamazuiensis]